MLKRSSISYLEPKDIDPDLYYELEPWESDLNATHFTMIPSEDGWDRVKYYARRDKIFSRLGGGEGYMYILKCTNQPGILKIGMTERTPNERLNEINRGTGIIVPWILVEAFPCKAPRAIEKMVHMELQKYRVNTRKEGFNVTEQMARDTVQRVINANNAEIES